MSELHREWKFKALTDIWTGDADQKGGRLITTGLLGSIRWWFEVLVRGLDGSACGPSDGDTRCPDKQGQRCVVCELFGCTGWARKFRFQVVDQADATIQQKTGKNEEFILRFIPLRPIRSEEWALLDLTLRLIADHGAIGGKTVLKPSKEKHRAGENHHKDLGLIRIKQRPPFLSVSKEALEGYLQTGPWLSVSHNGFAWASLEHFWSVKNWYLARENTNESTFNRVLGRNESKACRDCGKVHDPPQRCPKTGRHPRRLSERLATNDKADLWLAGHQQESKKVFSFKDPARTFGFVKPGTVNFDEMKKRLKDVWTGFNDNEFLEGSEILNQLFSTPGGTH